MYIQALSKGERQITRFRLAQTGVDGRWPTQAGYDRYVLYYVYTYVCVYVVMYVCMYLRTYVCVFCNVCVFVCVCVCVCAHACVCVCVYTHTHTHVHTHIFSKFLYIMTSYSRYTRALTVENLFRNSPGTVERKKRPTTVSKETYYSVLGQ